MNPNKRVFYKNVQIGAMLVMYVRRDFYDKQLYLKWEMYDLSKRLVKQKDTSENICKNSSLINRY